MYLTRNASFHVVLNLSTHRLVVDTIIKLFIFVKIKLINLFSVLRQRLVIIIIYLYIVANCNITKQDLVNRVFLG